MATIYHAECTYVFLWGKLWLPAEICPYLGAKVHSAMPKNGFERGRWMLRWEWFLWRRAGLTRLTWPHISIQLTTSQSPWTHSECSGGMMQVTLPKPYAGAIRILGFALNNKVNPLINPHFKLILNFHQFYMHWKCILNVFKISFKSGTVIDVF